MGRQYHSKLVDKQKRFQDTPKGKGRKLLVPYEVYLLTKHFKFPPQAKKFLDEQKSAGAKRKGNRRAANVKAGLLDIRRGQGCELERIGLQTQIIV